MATKKYAETMSTKVKRSKRGDFLVNSIKSATTK